jgi:hypothetical protein
MGWPSNARRNRQRRVAYSRSQPPTATPVSIVGNPQAAQGGPEFFITCRLSGPLWITTPYLDPPWPYNGVYPSSTQTALEDGVTYLTLTYEGILATSPDVVWPPFTGLRTDDGGILAGYTGPIGVE